MPDSSARGPAAIALGSALEKDVNPGLWVEQRCAELGVSVWSVARAAGVDRTTLYRWKKSGQRPYWDSFRKVETVLGSIWDSKRRLKEGA